MMNEVQGILLILKYYALRIIFLVIRWIFNFLQHLWWHYNGTCRDLQAIGQPQYYKHSAHVINIIWRNHTDLAQAYSMSDFICTHNRFEHPDYVLRDNVSVFFLLEDAVVFAETDPEVRTWRLKYGAFQREANHHYAKRLIVMPLKSLERLGDKLGHPKQKLIFLFSTGRCGSTLLTQMFEHTGQCVSISEPDGLNYLAKEFMKSGETEKLRKLTTSFVNLLCKPVKDPKVNLAFVVNVGPPTINALSFFHELFPKGSYICMYRNVVNVAKSLYRVGHVVPQIYLRTYAGYFSQKIVETSSIQMGIPGEEFKVPFKDMFSFGTLQWCITLKQYLDQKKLGINIRCLRYEDLVADTIYVMKAVMRHCQLPEELAKYCTKALEQDSQVTSILSRSAKFRAPDLTPLREANMNEILTKFSLPNVGEENIFEGIIGLKGD